MNLYEKIKLLCDKEYISIAQLERETGLSNGSIKRWVKSSPSVANLKKVAIFFNVSIGFLVDDEDALSDINKTKETRIIHRAAENMTDEERKKTISLLSIFFDNWEYMTKDNK